MVVDPRSGKLRHEDTVFEEQRQERACVPTIGELAKQRVRSSSREDAVREGQRQQ